MYKFNELLFSHLHLLVKMSSTQFSLWAFGNKNKYLQKNGSGATLPVTELVRLCNRLHMSIANFITIGESDAFSNEPSLYIIDESIFHPIIFRHEMISHIYGPGSLTGMSKQKICELADVSSMSLYLYGKPQSTISMGKLLNLCNVLGLELSSFFEDNNMHFPNNTARGIDLSPAGVLHEVLLLRGVVSETKLRINQLTSENEHLRIQLGIGAHEREQDGASEWVFNQVLLRSLPSMFDIDKMPLFQAVGVSNPSVSVPDDGNIPVRVLVDVCNHYRISIRHFFVNREESEQKLLPLKSYQPEPYQPCCFHPDLFDELFGTKPYALASYREVTDHFQYTKPKLQGWRASQSTLRVNDLAALCNYFSVSPWLLIDDPNEKFTAWSHTEKLILENRKLRSLLTQMGVAYPS